MAGPCSVETEEQIISVARSVKAAGAQVLRGGAFKPRTSPYAFQGKGVEGVLLLDEARKATGLPIVSELMSADQLPLFEEAVDVIQIGARNMQNFDLLKKVGKSSKPILLKRGLSSTIEEWLMSAEYIMAGGNPNVILCERGIRTFETYTRNTLDLSAVLAVKRQSHLPVVVDPSHACGQAWMVERMSLAAIAAALEKLGLSREEVSVEVLELAKPGFLGIGGTLAKVRVSYEGPDEELVEEPVVQEAPKAAPAEQEAPKAEDTAPAEAPAAPEKSAAAPADDDVSAKIVDFLTGLLSRLEVSAQAQVSVDGEGNYLVELVGEGLGAIIGRRGETLDAIQQLTNYSVNKSGEKRVRVHVDAENYRLKREQSLQHLARKVAGKVLRFKRNVTLEPMNAYERHVIHTALQNVEGVTTYSMGTEPNRRVIVAYDRGGNKQG